MIYYIISKNPTKCWAFTMVQVVGKCLHEIEAEISRWRDILAVEYAQYLRGDLILHPIVDLH